VRVVSSPRPVAAAALCVLLTASLTACPEAGLSVRTGTIGQTFWTPQATAFLTTYVRPDGRVARPDQGNDTVSEGQAYGLLLAETAGPDRLVRRIWRWTRDHLQRDDGLFAWRAGPTGQVLSRESASDADLLIAWALLRYGGPGADALHSAGRQVADAILAHETVTGPEGRPVLTAGPWATQTPATLNPSYWSLPALTDLARLTGDPTWQQLADSAVLLTSRLTHGGQWLPPDWAELSAAGHLAPRSAPDWSQPVPQYGLDAQRTVAWFAASCDPRANALAARSWRVLDRPARYQALALRLDGAVLDPTRAVLPLVAAAAAASADDAKVDSVGLLRLAEVQQHRSPGYYGGAWSAFGLVLLNSRALSGC
jgi:endo-1,4-beta-D-glucanase Y